jgi:hypothetical protein
MCTPFYLFHMLPTFYSKCLWKASTSFSSGNQFSLITLVPLSFTFTWTPSMEVSAAPPVRPRWQCKTLLHLCSHAWPQLDGGAKSCYSVWLKSGNSGEALPIWHWKSPCSCLWHLQCHWSPHHRLQKAAQFVLSAFVDLRHCGLVRQHGIGHATNCLQLTNPCVKTSCYF